MIKTNENVDKLIEELTDWRGKTLAEIRKVVFESDSDIDEDWKWMGSPVWEKNGIICLAVICKDKVKLTFPDGANLDDSDKIFNNGLGGKKWRTIDFPKNNVIKSVELKKLICTAIDYNLTKKSMK